jgi:cysteine desulfurase
LPEPVHFIPDDGSPFILSLSLPGYKSEVLYELSGGGGRLQLEKLACKRGARSHVLGGMGVPSAVIDGALRVSFSGIRRRDEADYFCRKAADARGETS